MQPELDASFAVELLASGGLWAWLLPLTVLALAYLGVGRLVWGISGLALLSAFTIAADVSWWSKLFVWVLFIAVYLPLNLSQIRRRLLSDPLLNLYRSSMPDISPTERDALEAGSTWWDAELFTGRPRWRRLLNEPRSVLSDAERDFLEGPTNELCEMLNDWEINDQHQDLPPEAWAYIKEQGFLGMIIPESYGGKGFSATGHANVVSRIASRSISAALTVMIPNSVGPAKLLLRYGTQAQRDHYLPRLASGEEIPCFALTGPDAGSDASAMTDAGVVCRGEWQGEEVLGVRLNFEKRYITLAPVATVLGLAFKLNDPEGLLGEPSELGITLALVSTALPGVSHGRRHDPLGLAFMNGPVTGEDVFIPLSQLIGGADYAGKGWRMLMECLTDGRAISLPALSAGAAKLATRATGAYAAVRHQFRVPIAAFEGVQEVLARIAGNTYLLEASRSVTLSALDQGHKPSVVSAMMKYNSTARARSVIEDAMDVHAGAGICLGPHNLIGQYVRFPNMAVTVEGANILTRTLITFGQGAIRCHPFLFAELEAATDEDREAGAKRFDRLLVKHLAFSVRNGLRSLVLGLTAARLALAPVGSGRTAKWFKRTSRMSAAFALVTDILLVTQRGELKRRERLSGRMADVVSQLYLASCALKHFHDQGARTEDIDALEWAMRDTLWRAQEALYALFQNLPRWSGMPLRLLTFPWGRSYHPPGDHLVGRLAESISAPTSQRDRLTAGMFLPLDPDAQLWRLEDALVRTARTAPLERKLRDGRRMRLVSGGSLDEQLDSAVENRVLVKGEAEELAAADRARRLVLAVDDFAADMTGPRLPDSIR